MIYISFQCILYYNFCHDCNLLIDLHVYKYIFYHDLILQHDLRNFLLYSIYNNSQYDRVVSRDPEGMIQQNIFSEHVLARGKTRKTWKPDEFPLWECSRRNSSGRGFLNHDPRGWSNKNMSRKDVLVRGKTRKTWKSDEFPLGECSRRNSSDNLFLNRDPRGWSNKNMSRKDVLTREKLEKRQD